MDLCPPNYLTIHVKNCCMHLTISWCAWILKFEDLNAMDILVVIENGMWFVQMASRSKTFIDFDADWGETIPYEGRYGLNHFSTIYCV